jgi:1-deoxy-D-xylulose-5-phosphate reductoisomerase
MKKRIAILGSTGSIGTQALKVVSAHPNLFEVEVLTANSNCDALIRQSVEFRPNAVVIGKKNCYQKVSDALKDFPIKVWAGEDALSYAAAMESVDLVLSAMVGFSGLVPTLRALEAGKPVALANKESLVIAGELMMAAAVQHNTRIIPVDSEHSAIFQCLVGEHPASVEKIFLTASGGPFRGKGTNELHHVTREDALAHPNWKMGSKITVDSASMMNKGLEVIEARWLFDLAPSQIEVIIHPQSVIHSIVQFIDGSMKVQMGLPDMKLPILYAMSYPHRISSEFRRFSFTEYPTLTFEPPDMKVFRNLGLAYRALQAGGNLPCILNAANEAAVAAFLDNRVSFLQMSDIIEHCMQQVAFLPAPGLPELISSHHATIDEAAGYISKI